jgi:hypothetical protein
MKKMAIYWRRRTRCVFGSFASLSLLGVLMFLSGPMMAQFAFDKVSMQKQLSELSHPPFVRNDGQIKDQDGNYLPNVRYLLHAEGMKVQIRPDGFSYDTWVQVPKAASAAGEEKRSKRKGVVNTDKQTETERMQYHRVDVAFKGGNPNPVIEALDPVEEHLHYISSNFELEVTERCIQVLMLSLCLKATRSCPWNTTLL